MSLSVMAGDIKTVRGKYIYHAPENVTLEDAKNTALERAMLQALADEFGTYISASNTTFVGNSNGKSEVDFFSLNESEVKGEWIETIGVPKYDVVYHDNMLIVTCQVAGKAREINNEIIGVSVKLLRNGFDDKCESSDFNHGDNFYLSIHSPIEGYLAVYLVDEDRDTYCILPYSKQTDGIVKVPANNPVIFFSSDRSQEIKAQFVDEYVLECDKNVEHNQVYIIFSPNRFVKATDKHVEQNMPRSLKFDDFQKWLTQKRKHDKSMNVIIKTITIKNIN